eukprot:gene407-440_t
MDAEALRKKRMEEIEAKRKRLEEMRKVRLTTSETSDLKPSEEKPPVKEFSTSHDNKQNSDINAFISSVLSSKPLISPSGPPSTEEKNPKEDKTVSFAVVKSLSYVDIPPIEVVRYDKSCQTESEDHDFLGQNDQESSSATLLINAEKRSARRLGTTALKTVASWHSDAFAGTNMTASEGAFHPPSATKEARVKGLSEEEKAAVLSEDNFHAFLSTKSLYMERALELNSQHDILRNYAFDTQGHDQRNGGSTTFEFSMRYEDDNVKGRPVMDINQSSLHSDLFLVAYGSRQVANTPSGRGSVSAATATLSQSPDDNNPGIVYVWSSTLHKRPEFRFYAMSPVLTAIFHIAESHLVLGGCYNGQVILWDMRSNKTLPIYRSSLTGKGHKYPIYAMSMLSSATNSELLTLSIDGLLCHWDVNQLNEPLMTTNVLQNLLSPNPSQLMNLLASPQSAELLAGPHGLPLNSCCMAVNSGDDHTRQSHKHIANLLVGCGSGHIVSVDLSANLALNNSKQIEAHFGLVSCLHCHPSSSTKYRFLMLSCSLDWSVKLWHLQRLSKPLLEFGNIYCDYIAAVQWCPTHPGVFAAITSGGKLTIWNIARSVTEAIDAVSILGKDSSEESGTVQSSVAAGLGVSTSTSLSTAKSISNMSLMTGGKVNGGVLHRTHSAVPAGANNALASATAFGASGANVALCKLSWSIDGQTIYVGDSLGNLHCVRVHGNATVVTPQDEHKLEMVLMAALENTAMQQRNLV